MQPDGPQATRRSFKDGDEDAPAPVAAADEPVVSGPRLKDLDLTKPGWHQIVEGGIWEAAVVVLGSEAVAVGGHKFCYVIAAVKLAKMIGLSAGIAADENFVRQVRRLCLR